MTQTLAVQPQNLDYYNYFVICNYVFNAPEPVIENGYTYEENGVLYCASATQKGVYCYTYARNNPLKYTDPSGEFIWIPILIGAVVAATTYTVQAACMPGGLQQNWNFGQFAFNTMFGAVMGGFSAGIGMALTPALAAVGISGAAGGAITGAVTGTFTGTMNGLLQYSMTGDANAIWKGALIGMGTGALIGGISGGIEAAVKGQNFWDGGPTLKTKLAMMVEQNRAQLLSEIGEADATVQLGTRKNLAGTDHRAFGGKMYSSNGDEAAGFAKPGKAFGLSSDGYPMYGDNEIYLSKNTVRGMWKGHSKSIGTLFHEWQHGNDFFTGMAEKLYQNFGPTTAINMLEYRAHSVANSLYYSPWRQGRVNSLFDLLFVGPR